MTQIRSPLHDRHVAADAKFADFAGWSMPLEYAGTVSEHTAVREAVGVFDVSHLGTLTVGGPLSALNSVLTNDLDRISDGQAQYTLLLNEAGGVVDDLIAYRVGDQEALLVPNAANHPCGGAGVARCRTGGHRHHPGNGHPGSAGSGLGSGAAGPTGSGLHGVRGCGGG
ncbi:MAG: hypothetical protein V9G10_01890 [Candidatus Nanopelagicales bacterium]